MTTLQQLRQPCARPSKPSCFTSVRPTATAVKRSQQQHGSSMPAELSRRSLLAGLSTAGLISSSFLQPQGAAANPLEDIARQLTRPDITPLDAAVALLDARATLKEMAPLVASGPDSRERFEGRKLWPAYAKWLRPVGPSAPVAAAIIAGSTDTEATLSAEYGGTGGSNAAVDAVYVALGRVLTISGRTIKDEAQVEPELITAAEVAINDVINQLPKQLVEEAQQFRVARAAGKA